METLREQSEAHKTFILKSAKEMENDHGKMRCKYSFNKTLFLKKKRFKGMYKSMTPQKPEKIKGVIIGMNHEGKEEKGK